MTLPPPASVRLRQLINRRVRASMYDHEGFVRLAQVDLPHGQERVHHRPHGPQVRPMIAGLLTHDLRRRVVGRAAAVAGHGRATTHDEARQANPGAPQVAEPDLVAVALALTPEAVMTRAVPPERSDGEAVGEAWTIRGQRARAARRRPARARRRPRGVRLGCRRPDRAHSRHVGS